MKRAAAIGAAGAAAVAVAACGSSARPYQDAQTCKGLSGATSLVASGAYGLSGGNTYTPIAQEQVAISDTPKGALSPGFRRDALAVISAGLNNPSAATVARLQGDCDRLGITKRIWPEQLTG
jgi:hypothetical protein